MKVFTQKQPQEKNRVTQEFGERPSFYKKYGFRGHEWLDINDIPWTPTPVYAVEDGTIVVSDGRWPYWIRIDLYAHSVLNPTSNDVRFWYAHLSKVEVKNWDIVQAWDIIWYTGKTGTEAIHLHIMAEELDDNLEVINTNNGYAW